jgi:hypothetical protein
LFDLGSRSSRLTAAQSQGDDLYLYDKPPKPPAMPCRWFLICGYRIAGRAGPDTATTDRQGPRISAKARGSPSKATSLQRLPLFKDYLSSKATSLQRLPPKPKGYPLKAEGAASEDPFAGGDESPSAAVRPRSSDSRPIHSDSWAGTPRDFLARHPATHQVRRATAKVTRGTRRP